MDDAKKIEELISDREKFNAFVYTPLNEAVKELGERNNDEALEEKVSSLFGDRIPQVLKNEVRLVLSRHIITPNYEVCRFLGIADALDIKALFFEYHDDKLVFKNPWKYSLCRLCFHFGMGKKGGAKIDHVNIVDFDKYHGKKMSEAKTIWGQSLPDFHHELFVERFPDFKESLFDASEWYVKNGGNPQSFYANFLGLFVKNAILFENFMLDEEELPFTRDVFLPAFLDVIKKTGKKPLIVALTKTEIEGDQFWLCHPNSRKQSVEKKLQKEKPLIS